MSSFYRDLTAAVCLLIVIFSVALAMQSGKETSCAKVFQSESAAFSDLQKGSRLFSNDIAPTQDDDI